MVEEWPPGSSLTYGYQLEDPRDGFSWLQSMLTENRKILVITRLAPQRLGKYIKLENISFKWVSNRTDNHSIDASLERIHHYLSGVVNDGNGLIWLDAVEYLSDFHGFDSMLHFIQSIADTLNGTGWTMVLPYSPLAFKATEVAKIRREAPNLQTISHDTLDITGGGNILQSVFVNSDVSQSLDKFPKEIEESENLQIEVEPGLLVLSRIPEASLSRAILQRRMEQWKKMGFDVSELEPLILVDDRKSRFERYFTYEEKVRRATECERRIRELRELGFTSEAEKLNFKAMQLTGIESIEREIERLLAEAR